MRNAFDYLQLPNPMNIASAFQTGFDRARSLREEHEVKSALSAYAVNPDDEGAFQKLAQYKPELAIQIGQDRRKRQQQAAVGDLQRRAASGDKAALAELAGIDLDAWSKLDTRTQSHAKMRVEAIGQAALLADTPEEWDRQVDQLTAQGIDVSEYRGRFDMRESAIASAGLAKQFMDAMDPRYQVIPEGGTLVNTNDPAAIQSFVGGAGIVATPEQQAESARLERQFPGRTAPSSEGISVPRSKADFDALPPGSRYVAPDGTMRIKGGGAGNGTGNFPR